MEEPKKVAGGAFGRFLNANRPQFAKECAGKPVTVVLKLASERFKALSAAERSVWEEKYKEARAKYDKDLAAFLAAGGEKKAVKRKADRDDNGRKKRKKDKDPDAPKRPCGGAYACYLEKHRKELSRECVGKPVTAVTKLAGERWKALGDAEKQPFVAEYEARKAAYDKAMLSYTPPPASSTAEPPSEGSAEKNAKKVAKMQRSQERLERKAAAKEKGAAAPAKASAAAATGRGRGRGRSAGKKAAPASVANADLEGSVAERAEKQGLTSSLQKLMARQDIISSGKTQAEVLKALEDSGGLIHPARRALLGA